jgi:hypothetical protein
VAAPGAVNVGAAPQTADGGATGDELAPST